MKNEQKARVALAILTYGSKNVSHKPAVSLVEVAILARNGRKAPVKSPHQASYAERMKATRLRNAKTLGEVARISKEQHQHRRQCSP